MKTKSILALTALCLALPAGAGAQGLPEFLSTVGEGIGEGMEKGAAVIAASMEEELGVTLSMTDVRMEAGKALTLTVTATNPRFADTPVSFALKLPERLSCAQETDWDAVLPPAAEQEDGTVTPSVTTFERTIALAPGGVSEKAQILCEMSMGTRFYRAQQDVELCVADVDVVAMVEGAENNRLEPGDAFTWKLEVTNAGMADKEVSLALVLPDAVRMTCVTAASAAEPENGRSSTTLIASLGIPSSVHTGEQSACALSMSPVSRSSDTAVRIAHRYGAISKAVSRPSFAPRTNAVYASAFIRIHESSASVISAGISSDSLIGFFSFSPLRRRAYTALYRSPSLPLSPEALAERYPPGFSPRLAREGRSWSWAEAARSWC